MADISPVTPQNGVSLTTFVYETCNTVVNRNGTQADLEVFPDSADLTRKYHCPICVDGKESGGAVGYLMEYASNLPPFKTID